MNLKYIHDHHIVERYLADQLDDAEREAFEAYAATHPEIVAELESVARLKVGLAALRDSNQLTQVLRARSRAPRLIAIAAALAIVTIGALLFLRQRAPDQPVLVAAISSLQLPIAATYEVLRVRGASADARIELPSSPSAITLRVLTESEAEHYTLTLMKGAVGAEAQQLASLAGLVADADGYVTAYLHSSALSKGDYQLVLQSDAAAGTTAASSRFTLEVVDPLPPAN